MLGSDGCFSKEVNYSYNYQAQKYEKLVNYKYSHESLFRLFYTTNEEQFMSEFKYITQTINNKNLSHSLNIPHIK